LTSLSRTVRFAVNPPGSVPEIAARNGKGGFPPVAGLGRWFEFAVECRGQPDKATGYLVDIRTIDAAVREHIAPIVARTCLDAPETEPGALLPEIVATAHREIGPTVHTVTWRVTPYYSVSMDTDDTSKIRLAQRFEFAAAHRLHSPQLSESENRAVYGKCNNPAGHGHNYQVEPVVEVTLGRGGEQPFTLVDLERCTTEAVIDRFDHKHLNTDVEEFAGRIPSVELIAQVAHSLLAPVVDRESGHAAKLVHITVWETEKTCATYPA